MRLKNEGGFGQIRTKVYVLAVLLFYTYDFYHFNRNLIISSACQQRCLNSSLGFPQALSKIWRYL